MLMKIRLGELRNIIRRELIKEAAVSPTQAVSQGLAMFSRSTGNVFETYILYQARGIFPSVKGIFTKYGDDYLSFIKPTVVGAIQVSIVNSQNETAYIEGVKSFDKGYGPLLYDVALKYHGPLRPSPDSVTPAAEKIWQGYRTMRRDVVYQNEPRMISGGNIDVEPLFLSHEKLCDEIGKEKRDSLELSLYNEAKYILKTLKS